jgi:DNA-binding NarL/FixJ family response regulator
MGELTPKEKQVLALVAKGLTNDEIAEELNVKSGTIRTHIHSIYDKMLGDDDDSRVKRVRVAMTVWQVEQGNGLGSIQS